VCFYLIEVEVKAKVDDLKKFEVALKAISAQFIKKVEDVDLYFNAPHKDYMKTDEALRIRRRDDEISVTYKGPKFDLKSKSREEVNLLINDAFTAEKLFELLGFRKAGVVKKTRLIFKLSDVEVSLDEVEGLGSFIEIETESMDKKEAINKRDELLKVLKSLGIEESAFERRSYLELLLK